MKGLISLATAGALAITVALAPNVAAQQQDTLDKTFLTFSSTVELPGTTLPAGTYVFRIADTPSRNVVQVMSENEEEILGQWLFVPAERQEATNETVITFRETAAGATPAVQYWYYPGERTGKEFIYPRDQAVQIAQRTGATVMTEEGPVTAEAQASANAAGSQPAESSSASSAREPEPEPAAQAEVGVAARSGDRADVSADASADAVGTSGTAAQQAPEATTARAELPQTASPLALSGLIALFSLAGAAGLRMFRP